MNLTTGCQRIFGAFTVICFRSRIVRGRDLCRSIDWGIMRTDVHSPGCQRLLSLPMMKGMQVETHVQGWGWGFSHSGGWGAISLFSEIQTRVGWRNQSLALLIWVIAAWEPALVTVLRSLTSRTILEVFFNIFEELMLLNCGVGEDSWESLGLQGDPTSPFWRRSALAFLWKEWC